jgi:RNA polymerase sigma-70 factor (ECF subfamily)
LSPSAADAYRALAPAVLGYLRAERVPDPDDVLGEVFLQVARDIHRFKGDDQALRRWVFTIAHNRAVDAHRRRARSRVHLDGRVPERLTPPPADPFDPELIAALDTLTPDQREVVVLRFVADLPLEAVARITRRRVGAVKALQHRGLENLGRTVSREQ